jgi:hypothetical protein
MAHSLPNRLTLALAAGAAASALAAAPALATEGPAAPPPAPTLPSGIAPPSWALPSPALQRTSTSRVVRRLRVAPRRVRRGRRARLTISLRTPSRLRIVLSRTKGRKRVRTASITLPARGTKVSVRLPKRAHGHLLRADRYRISVVALDATGAKSAPVRTPMIVRRARR